MYNLPSPIKLEEIIDHDLEISDNTNKEDYFILIQNFINTYNEIKKIINNIDSIIANKNININILNELSNTITKYRTLLQVFTDLYDNENNMRYNILIEELIIREQEERIFIEKLFMINNIYEYN